MVLRILALLLILVVDWNLQDVVCVGAHGSSTEVVALTYVGINLLLAREACIIDRVVFIMSLIDLKFDVLDCDHQGLRYKGLKCLKRLICK